MRSLPRIGVWWSTSFNRAITAFGEAYADRNLADHERRVAAVDAGELEVDPNP